VHKSHWEKAQQAVRNLREARDKSGSGCAIGVGFVVTPDNWREVLGAAQLAKDLGADNIRISAQFSNEDEKLFESFHEEAVHICKWAERISDKNFTVYNRFGDRLEDLKLKQPEDRLCGYQFFTTYIGADLNIYRCCGYAYNERGLVGSIANQRFKDFWMSQERFDNQINFDGRGCERCQFRRINSALAYALDTTPQLHEEFV
jgi:radical SAM protein with 4Fe4S-binding SPASM domain